MGASNRQNGAVAPLIAVLLLVIVVCVAFVVDLGHIHNVKVELQRAVDAAALAGAKQLPKCANVRTVARAVLDQNSVDAKLIKDIPSEEIAISILAGTWNSDESMLGKSPEERWNTVDDQDACRDTGGEPANAVFVSATRNVQHAFFFFKQDTEVVADAIALAKPIYPVLPLAMVSCVPTDAATHPPGTLPKMTICGVVGHVFNSDPSDRAAWSSLTFGPASATNILNILQDEGGFTMFNKVLFGRGIKDKTLGIENDPVSTSRPGSFDFDPNYDGCINDGLDINCGLGEINGKEIAPPSDFAAPAGIPPIQTSTYIPTNELYYSGSTSFDPLAGYSILPRWYNINNNTGFDSLDHFIRVVSQDGILLRHPDETPANFETRIVALKDGSLRPYGSDDSRFVYDNQKGDNNFIDKFNRPNYLAIARYAGYPQVHVMNGVTTPIMQAFMKRVFDVDALNDITDNTPLPCSDNTTAPTGLLESVKINVPVIFAGNCANWDAVDESGFVYIGMADFLMTRAQLTGVMYACPEGERGYAGSCTETFAPPLDGTQEFGPVTFSSPVMIEGVYSLPTTDDDDKGGLVRVLLVE